MGASFTIMYLILSLKNLLKYSAKSMMTPSGAGGRRSDSLLKKEVVCNFKDGFGIILTFLENVVVVRSSGSFYIVGYESPLTVKGYVNVLSWPTVPSSLLLLPQSDLIVYFITEPGLCMSNSTCLTFYWCIFIKYGALHLIVGCNHVIQATIFTYV